MNYSHIIWDFNGTLMNDVDIAVAAVNDMLRKRGMELTTKEQYLTMITAPIIDYYKKVFDLKKVSFDDLTGEFLESYNLRAPSAGLMPGAREALETFRDLGIVQCVISSFEQERLTALIRSLGVEDYFDEISGADNVRAEGKLDRGAKWMERRGVDPAGVLVIGDLVHDYEMASHLGAACVLIAAGHQHKNELMATGAPVCDSIKDMMRGFLHA